jgi:hypothetical protein
VFKKEEGQSFLLFFNRINSQALQIKASIGVPLFKNLISFSGFVLKKSAELKIHLSISLEGLHEF